MELLQQLTGALNQVKGVNEYHSVDTAKSAYENAGQKMPAGTHTNVQDTRKTMTAYVSEDAAQQVAKVNEYHSATTASERYQGAGEMKSTAVKVGVADESEVTEQTHNLVTPLVRQDVAQHVDGVSKYYSAASAVERYQGAGAMKQAAEQADIVDAKDLTQGIHADVTPMVAEDIRQKAQSVNPGATAESNVTAYAGMGAMKQAAEQANITDPAELTSLTHEQVTPVAADTLTSRVAKVDSYWSADRAKEAYGDAGAVKQAMETSGTVDVVQLTEQTHAAVTPLVGQDLTERVASVNQYHSATSASEKYRDVGAMKQTAESAGIVDSDVLTKQAHTEITPLVQTDVVDRVKTVGQYNSPNTAAETYLGAGTQMDAAKQAGIVDDDVLTTGVRDEATPQVITDVTEYVGKDPNPKVLARKYPGGGKMLGAATEAGIVHADDVATGVDSNLSKGLLDAQKESWSSGKWDKLALQKIAEESKLFKPETLAAVKQVMHDLLEGSIRASVGWGDRREALDKLRLVQSTGLISDGDAKKLEWQYLLRESLM